MASANKESLFLRDSYYRIKSIQKDGEDGVFSVKILPESKIFEGHFPGNAICPGVCNIEIIRECACLLTGWKLNISGIKQCRFVSVARPDECGELKVHVHATEVPSADSFAIIASISDEEKNYVTFKGEMGL